MDIMIGGESLDLPESMTVDVEKTNPLFHDIGSVTYPFTVPATVRNRRLLGFPERLDSDALDKLSGAEIVLLDGGVVRTGVLNILSVDLMTGIELNVGLDNSFVYESWSKKKLSEIYYLPKYSVQATAGESQVQALLDDLYYKYRYPDSVNDDFALFAVGVGTLDNNDGDGSSNWHPAIVLNAVYNDSLEQPQTIDRNIDGELTQITVPPGYGITPFLRVWRILELIFAEYGLEIKKNPFKTNLDLSRLVVLNNVADSCCRGFIDYADLMPDVTVEEFMYSLWVRFGLVYDIDMDSHTVSLRLVKDIVRDSAGMVLDDEFDGMVKMTRETPKYVLLSASTSLSDAAPVSERFEDFISGKDPDNIYLGNKIGTWTYGQNGNEDWDGWEMDDRDPDVPDPEEPDPEEPDPEDPDPDDRDPDGPEQDYYTRSGDVTKVKTNPVKLGREFVTGRWALLDRLNGKVLEYSSSFFNWDPRPDGMEALELNSVDECVPIRAMSSRGVFGDFTKISSGLWPAYSVGVRNKNTVLKDRDQKDVNESTPLAFMFAYNINSRTVGRLTPEGEDGYKVVLDDGTVPELSLYFHFSDGLYTRFWKEYDYCLRHALNKADVTICPGSELFRGMNMLRPVVLQGVRCLIDSFSYTVPGNATGELTLRTLRIPEIYSEYESETIRLTNGRDRSDVLSE